MNKCNYCTHPENDCGFPDCMGGWEVVYKDLQQQIEQKDKQIKAMQETESGEKTSLKARNIENDVKRIRETTNKTYWNQVQESKHGTNV